VCLTCGGSGDLFTDRRFNDFGSSHVDDVRAVTFSRGFVGSVSCTLGEVGRDDLHPHIDRLRTTWASSEWAKAVVKAAPVTKFVLTDLDLLAMQSVPSQLLKRIEGQYRSGATVVALLAVELGRLVREEVYGKAVAV
jgi:hypothetical protein